MKLLTGAILLLTAEQAYAHAQLIGFPNHESAAEVLVPASLILLILGSLLMVWGLATEARAAMSPRDLSSGK